MLCPHCNKEIQDAAVTKAAAAIAGRKSRRTLTAEQAREMVRRREDRRKDTDR